MERWESIFSILVFVIIYIKVVNLKFLHGKYRGFWLSLFAGTAMAYVFAYLLPKLAHEAVYITDQFGFWNFLIQHRGYLFALFGFMVFFIMGNSNDNEQRDPDVMVVDSLFLMQLLGYGLYNFQVGYLMREIEFVGYTTLVLATLILSVHLMGLNHHICESNKLAYQRVFRWAFSLLAIAGWIVGHLTDLLYSTVALGSLIIAGGILATSIRDELPGRESARPLIFFASAVTMSLVIIWVRYTQFPVAQ